MFTKEFPTYPANAMPALPADFADTSWHNDSCPSFLSEARGLKLWIDYPEKADREFGTPRFTVVPYCSIEQECGADLLTTDDWAEVVAFLAQYEVEAR